MRNDAPRLLAGAWFLTGGLAVATPAPATPQRSIDSAFRAAYPLSTAAVTPQLAGVSLGRLAISGLQIKARSEHAPEEGGVALSLSDGSGVVRVLIRVAVCTDAATARRVLDTELHGVSSQLDKAVDGALGDNVWADAAGRGDGLVIATHGNIAYAVDVISPAASVPTAAVIAGRIRAAMISGAPAFPRATVTLPASIDAKRGGDIRLQVPGGQPYKLRADGGYVARSATGPVVRPFRPGPITVYATIVDDLARVTVAAAATIARYSPKSIASPGRSGSR